MNTTTSSLGVCGLCRSTIPPSATRCSTCGARPGVDRERVFAPSPPPEAVAYRQTSSLAIVGLVAALFCSPVGLAMSLMAKSEIKNSGGTLGGEGLATAGIWLSAICLAIGVLVALGGH